jgi:hypothetical protein
MDNVVWGAIEGWTNAGEHEASNGVFCWDSENEYQDLVVESSTAEVKEGAAHSLRTRDAGAPASVATSFVPANPKTRTGDIP